MRRSRVGGVAYVGLAAALFVAPALVSRPWTPGGAGSSAADGSETSRVADRIGKVEGWASEGFAGLAAEATSGARPPTWEEVRRLMERRDCTELAYVVRVHHLRGGEEVFDETLVRHPYREPQHAEEFLRFLRGGPAAAVREGAGEPPREAEATGDDSRPPPPR